MHGLSYYLLAIPWDAVTAIASLFTALTVVLVTHQVRLNRQQVQFASITHCIGEFRKLEGLNRNASSEIVSKYVDLANEELFYMQHGYLPKEICVEWIEGMIEYMAIHNPQGQLLNAGFCLLYLEKLPALHLRGYDRVKKTFTASGDYNWEIIYSIDLEKQTARGEERRKLALELYKNVRAYKF